MRLKWAVFTVLCMLCTFPLACTAVEETNVVEESLFINYPIGVVEVRLHNTSHYDIDMVTMSYGDTTHEFGALAIGETTDFVDLPFIFQGFNGQITIDDKIIDSNVHEMPDFSGESPITGGSYTFNLNGDLDQGYFGGDLMPNVDVAQKRLKPLIAMLDDGGIRVQYEPSVQRENFFDMQYGAGTAVQDLLKVNGKRMLVFVFGSVDSAEAAADLIAEKGKYVSINLWSGEHPVWWQINNVLLLTEGRDATHHQAITQALATPPIGGEPAVFIPTVTPPTPNINSDVYVARLNYDPNNYHSALLTGKLVIKNKCVFVQGQDETDTSLIIWPRRYIFDESGILPAIFDENGDVVFTIGEKAYLGGSGTSMIDFSDRQDQLITPIPDSCGATSVWFASGALPKEYRDEAVGTTDHALIYAHVAQEIFGTNANTQTVIRNRTTRQGVPGYLPKDVTDLNISPETIDAYHLVNEGMKDIDLAFANNDRFIVMHPSVETENDIALTFSDIGFDQTRTEALLFVMNDCGVGQGNPCTMHYISLTKTDDSTDRTQWEIMSLVDIVK